MDYKLFTEFITLQALLKETGIIQSGGAIKGFLADHTVLVNSEPENRRGKKLRLDDVIELPAQGKTITLIAPSSVEIAERELELAEKKRVAELVKKMNQATKKQQQAQAKKAPGKKAAGPKSGQQGRTQTYRKTDDKAKKPAIRFPGVK